MLCAPSQIPRITGKFISITRVHLSCEEFRCSIIHLTAQRLHILYSCILDAFTNSRIRLLTS
jgi:hypothetical protein